MAPCRRDSREVTPGGPSLREQMNNMVYNENEFCYELQNSHGEVLAWITEEAVMQARLVGIEEDLWRSFYTVVFWPLSRPLRSINSVLL